MNKEVDKNLPVIFQKIDSYKIEDTRFIKVKIWLMHLNENLNGSYFDKQVVLNAIPTLANTPILAYIEDKDDEKDFSDHRIVLVKEKNEFKMKYLGVAIGLIPETNNAKFEYRVCDDGIEREFITCEGLIWQKWDDPVDIMNRDGIKSQSMEIHKDYTGDFKEDGLFHFTSFKFFGACALGDDILPAMRSASIELQDFSYDKFSLIINDKMEQFKKYICDYSQEGGNPMEDVIEVVKTVEEVIEIPNTEEVTEIVEIETKEEFADLQETNTEGTQEIVQEEQTEIVEEVIDIDKIKEEYELKIQELQNEITTIKDSYSLLETEVNRLKEFEVKKLSEERKTEEGKVFAQYSKLDGIAEYEEIRAKSSEFAKISDLEKEIALIAVKNIDIFSAIKQEKQENKFTKLPFEKEETEEKPYGGLFEKYSK